MSDEQQSQPHVDRMKINLMWKAMIFIIVVVIPALAGGVYSSVQKSSELDGVVQARLEANRRDIDRHEALINYLLTVTGHPLPLPPVPMP